MGRVKYLGITLAVVISLFLIFSQMVYASINVGTFDQTAYMPIISTLVQVALSSRSSLDRLSRDWR